MTKMIGAVLLTCLSVCMASTQAQGVMDTRPTIHKPIHDFTLNEIHYWDKTKASLKDFKGKWLILDAWNLGCSSCVASFFHLNELLPKIKDQATLLLVGKEHPLIRGWFEKYRAKEDLHLPIAYDSTLFKKFDIYTVPHIIIIDPDGVVQAITHGSDLTLENLQTLFSGKGNLFTQKYYGDEMYPEDDSKPFFVQNNAGPDDSFLFRSMLTKWNHKQSMFNSTFTDHCNWSQYNKNGIQLMGQTVQWLYFTAYLGKQLIDPMDSFFYHTYCRYPVLEIKDSSYFRPDPRKELYMYNYSLLVPDSLATNANVQKLMKRDLENYFGYTAHLEERVMPVWVARKGKGFEHLKTKGGVPDNIRTGVSAQQYRVVNITVEKMLSRLMELIDEPWPVFDETGSTNPIDLRLDCVIDNFDSVKKLLKENGIDIVPSTRKMKVLVLRDVN